MAVGHHVKLKIGVIIQARMRSTRLFGKILMPLPFPDGRPLLKWVVDGVKHCKRVNSIILATSVDPVNDPLESFSAHNGIHFLRGDENDVLSRFVDAIKAHNLDLVIRLTADNPFVDNETLDQAIEYHIKGQYDYTITTGLPLGMNFEVVHAQALLGQLGYDVTESDKEHVTSFMRRSNGFSKGIFRVSVSEGISKLRLTVDYPSDYAAVSLALSLAKGGNANLQLVKDIFEVHRWIFDVNSANIQREIYGSLAEERAAGVAHLEAIGLTHSADILRKHAIS